MGYWVFPTVVGSLGDLKLIIENVIPAVPMTHTVHMKWVLRNKTIKKLLLHSKNEVGLPYKQTRKTSFGLWLS